MQMIHRMMHTTGRPPVVPARWLAVAIALAALVCAAAAAAARADFDDYGIASVSAALSTTQAGAHPDFATTIALKTDSAGDSFARTRDITLKLPAGLAGNPQGIPMCTDVEFQSWNCPVDSQVGVTSLLLVALGNILEPVYNLKPPTRDVVARLGFVAGLYPTYIDIHVRSGSDYGLTATLTNLSGQTGLISATTTLWGVPADPSHDGERLTPGEAIACGSPPSPCLAPGGTRPSGLAPAAFMTNATSCGPQQVDFTAASYPFPDRVAKATASLPDTTGCASLRFDPSITVEPTTSSAGSPTGLDVELAFPQSDAVNALATSQLRDATVTLPQGMTISPAAADGLQACSAEQVKYGSESAAGCPGAAKIGTVTFDVPALPEALRGSIYQRSPEPGKLLRIWLVADDLGVHVKIPGEIHADPATGRLTTVFDDNPQLSVSKITLRFKDGARAPLTTPDRCGTFTTEAVLTSWSGRTARISSPMTIDQGCDRAGRFEPSLSAGTMDAVAGAASSFVMSFSRPDGQAELGAVNGSLPPGLLGVLASVPLCPAVQGAAGTCPAASRVGHVQVAAGAGSSPVWLPVAGQPANGVYLTEPYRKGDVAGMSIVTRAVAGPFDLGTVVTKVYLKLRPKDQGIDMQSERLPRILEGIPLQVRQVVVTIDRKGFMVNPTSCSAMATYANVFSQSWAKVPITSRFQVGGCAGLAFSPIIQVSGGGKGDTRRYEHPALKVTVRQPAGQAHLSKTNVVLPKELNIDLKAPALKAACTREDYAKDQCSPVATVGTARAVTPLLRQPLTGPAFLIQKKGKLPDLVMRLRNDRMSLDLIGVLDFLEDGRLITRVKGIPDAALSSFVLSIKGGKNGSLLNRSDLCAHKRLTKATFKGQNGKLSRKSPVTRISGCASKASASRAASRRAARVASAKASAARGAHAGAVHQRAAGGRS